MDELKADKLWGETEDLAKIGDVEAISRKLIEICLLDAARAQQLSRRLFLRIVNRHPGFIGDARPLREWMEWVQQSWAWQKRFANAALNPDALRETVAAALEEFRRYRDARAEQLRDVEAQVADILDCVMVRREGAHDAYEKLLAIRDELHRNDGRSDARELFVAALSAVAMAKETAPPAGAPDSSLEQIGRLKQSLRAKLARARSSAESPPSD